MASADADLDNPGVLSQKLTADLKVQDYLRIMDVVDAERTVAQEVQQQLSFSERIAAIKDKLRATYKSMGTEVDDVTLEKAIQDHLAQEYEFAPPQKDFSYSLAKAYVDRSRLGRKYGMPALVLSVLGGMGWGVLQAGKIAYHKTQEAAVEELVEKNYRQRQAEERTIQEWSSSPLRKQLPATEQAELSALLQRTTRELHKTDLFFTTFCDDGTADDDITVKNYPAAQRQLTTIIESLGNIAEESQRGTQAITYQRDLQKTGQELEATWASVQNQKLLAIFAERADTIYKTGTSQVRARQLPPAKNSLQQLLALQQDIQQFDSLAKEVEQVYATIKGTAKEDAAQLQATALYGEASIYQKNTQVPKLRETVQKLRQLEALLSEQYEVMIVSRPGVKSGQDRYYKDEQGRRVSGYYLIVEAVDPDGNVVAQNIVNEENQQTERVELWGVRVPQDVYERVKSDKKDDGILQDKVLGRKKRGYLAPQYEEKFSLQRGRITRW